MSNDIHALSGAYAVDALDDDERAQFEQHLAMCADCRHEVESLREAAALMAETTLAPPLPRMRDRVLADIAIVRPLPPRVAPVGAAGNGVTPVVPLMRSRRRRFATLLAAAAAVVLLGAGGVVWHSESHGGQSSPDIADQVMSAPDHQTYTRRLTNGATAIIYRSQKLNEAVLVTKGFQAAPSHTEYALWLRHDGTMVPAGVLPQTPDNTVVLSGDPSTASGAGITLEKAGSEPATPSDQVVANIPFRST